MQNTWKHRHGTEYERPLSNLETCFYWDSVFSRTADMIRCSEIKVISGQLEQIIDLANVSRAWTNTKKRFPLLGGRLEERNDDESVYIVVAEERLQTCLSEEISFREASSWDAATQLADALLHTNDHLSNDLLSRIFIIRDKERADCFYVLFVIAHAIADGTSYMTIIRTFLDELCGISVLDSMDVRDKLAISVASENLTPSLGVSAAKRRWKSATARIMADNRLAKRKRGGHGLPQKKSEKTPFTPGRSLHVIVQLPPDLSTRIIFNCREQGITFGNACIAIAQVATARLLLKRYLLGEIDEAEWEFRKKEPMFSEGPVNLRTFLKSDRQQACGFEDLVLLAIGFYSYAISFLPLGSASQLQPGMPLPPVGDLLTKERFLFRVKSVQRQAKSYLGNPLFLEVCEIMNNQREYVANAKKIGLQWRRERSPPPGLSGRFFTPAEQAAAGLIYGYDASSMGNMDRVLPRDYPLVNWSISNIKLQLGRIVPRLRCRPGELYLGTFTLHKELFIFVHFDGNVFEEEMTREWLKEIKMALEFYLGT